MTQITTINLNPNIYIQRFYYYQFTVKLYRSTGNRNFINDVFH